jgi:predicted AlkP superfamily pyrophosphatase or phosphodiesterase
LLALSLAAFAQQQTSVVMISIDGLKPDYVLEADKYHLKIPNLRRFLKEGMYATGVKGVLPTVTYPSHTTLVTGVSPAKHGILTNLTFDPYSKNMGGWYWYAEDIKAMTLWDAAAKAGLTTASVDWPVTVGANITFLIPQYWRASTPDDRKILRAISTPGLLTEVERVVGNYPEGYFYTIPAERQRAAVSAYILEKKKPQLHLAYLTALDEEQHASGPYSAKTFETLEELDTMIGQIRMAAEKASGGRAFVCVVSDHGFARTDKEVNLNAALQQAGLIELDDKRKVKGWQAYAWYGGGCAGIILSNPQDEATRLKVQAVLQQLLTIKDSGVDRVLDTQQAAKMGGFANAAFVVTVKPGYRLGSKLEGEITVPGKPGGTHGYAPDVAEMYSSFFLIGPGIPASMNLQMIDMRDIAPTLAGLLNLKLPDAEGRDLLKKR